MPTKPFASKPHKLLPCVQHTSGQTILTRLSNQNSDIILIYFILFVSASVTCLPPSPQIKHKVSHLRQDVIEANFYSGTLANSYGLDVLDLHFQFRFSLQHRTTDGVHWNALAHRKITSLLLQHSAQAWGVILPCPVATFGEGYNCTNTHTQGLIYTLTV